MVYTNAYWYQCAPGTETRGNRKENQGGCMMWNIRSTSSPISESNKPQGTACVHCGRRVRLNRGTVKEYAGQQTRVFVPNTRPGVPKYRMEIIPASYREQLAWAKRRVRELNEEWRRIMEERAVHMRISSNSSDDITESIEAIDESFEAINESFEAIDNPIEDIREMISRVREGSE